MNITARRPHRSARAVPTVIAAVAVLAVLTLVTACGGGSVAAPSAAPVTTPAPSPSAATAPSPPFDVVTGLDAPWSLARVGSSVLISERDSARVFEWTAAGDLRELAVIDDVAHGGEGGLLGLAAADGALYVYATTAAGNRVQAFALSGAWDVGTQSITPTGAEASVRLNYTASEVRMVLAGEGTVEVTHDGTTETVTVTGTPTSYLLAKTNDIESGGLDVKVGSGVEAFSFTFG